MKNTLLAALTLPVMMLSTCVDMTPVFADPDPAPTAADVMHMMARLPAEKCLYNAHGKGCDKPGGYDKGPDAARIADAIAHGADGSLTGTRREDAALMATFSSYESGNKADAVGDSGRARGAWQLHYVADSVAFDPARAVSVWRSIALGTMKAAVCRDNAPDERLAGVAGSCSYAPARRKVRQRVQVARGVLAEIE